MINTETLIKEFERTQWVINAQTKGLTHEDSLLQLDFWDNCMNWVLGHVAYYRDKALEVMNLETILTEEEASFYEFDSTPLHKTGKAAQLSRLLEALEASVPRLKEGLSALTEEQAAVIYSEKHQVTVGDRLEFIQWHETYHVGQLEILRQLAGTNDKII